MSQSHESASAIWNSSCGWQTCLNPDFTSRGEPSALLDQWESNCSDAPWSVCRDKKTTKEKKNKCNMMISFTFLLVLVEYTAKFTCGLTTFDNILLVGNPKLAEIFHFSSLNQRHLCRSWWTGAFKMNICLTFLAVLSNLHSYIFLFRCIDNHGTY